MKALKDHDLLIYKEKEEVVFNRALALVKADYERERDLEIEVNKMMDELERQNPGGFQRYKMFPMLKQRLAKEKGIVL